MSCHTPTIYDYKDLSQQKAFLRKRAKAFLKELIDDRNLAEQAKISASSAFLASEKYAEADIILGFMALPDEIDISPILEKALSDGKKIALPRMLNDSGEMTFHLITDFEKDFTCENKYNIREPSSSLPEITAAELTNRSVIFVPGLAFNLEGQRLGRGKGFYDRFLDKINIENKPVISGVCSVICITKAIPVDKNDKPVDFLLNEYGFVECKHHE